MSPRQGITPHSYFSLVCCTITVIVKQVSLRSQHQAQTLKESTRGQRRRWLRLWLWSHHQAKTLINIPGGASQVTAALAEEPECPQHKAESRGDRGKSTPGLEISRSALRLFPPESASPRYFRTSNPSPAAQDTPTSKWASMLSLRPTETAHTETSVLVSASSLFKTESQFGRPRPFRGDHQHLTCPTLSHHYKGETEVQDIPS